MHIFWYFSELSILFAFFLNSPLPLFLLGFHLVGACSVMTVPHWVFLFTIVIFSFFFLLLFLQTYINCHLTIIYHIYMFVLSESQINKTFIKRRAFCCMSWLFLSKSWRLRISGKENRHKLLKVAIAAISTTRTQSS